MQIPCWLADAAARAPGHPAVETTDGTVAYADLLDRADTTARRLAARGARAGDRVALALPAGPAFAEALHGCWRLGAVPLPIDPRLTTAAPRPIELTFGNLEASAHGSAAVLGHRPGERWLCALPVAHVGGLSILVRTAAAATTAVLHERFDAEAVAAALRDHGITLVSLVATMLARLLEAGLERPPALRCALLGGGALPPELAGRAAAARVPVAQTYGLTEACSQVTTSAIGEPETAGAPLPGTRVDIAADGEILVSGPTVAPGATGPDGVLHTGDLGELDAAGRLTVTGRKA